MKDNEEKNNVYKLKGIANITTDSQNTNSTNNMIRVNFKILFLERTKI